MATPAAPLPAEGRGTHLVLYDGVCGLCNFASQFILARDPRGTFDFASLQSATGRRWLERSGRNPDDLESFVLVRHYRTSPAVLDKSAAALAVVADLGAPWSWLRVFRVLPAGVRNALYDVIARHRYRWFGRYDVCRIPTPAERGRFVDV
jgi:predicted DCC family thiol-disulfide oxidoreductase YuxK